MKILIVEDEMLERKAMVHLIRTGFPQVTEILTAENGEKAVETALSAAGLSPRLSAAPRDSLGGAYVLEGGPVCSG